MWDISLPIVKARRKKNREKEKLFMKLVWKHFKELTTEELHEIYKLRVAVFVVEQNCPYQEVDETDKIAHHIWLKDEKGIQAYMRIFPKETPQKQFAFGRVIAVKRRSGLGSKIVMEGIRMVKENFDANSIYLEAQVYARNLYEKIGFTQTSEEFLEDGIPHVKMMLHF